MTSARKDGERFIGEDYKYWHFIYKLYEISNKSFFLSSLSYFLVREPRFDPREYSCGIQTYWVARIYLLWHGRDEHDVQGSAHHNSRQVRYSRPHSYPNDLSTTLSMFMQFQCAKRRLLQIREVLPMRNSLLVSPLAPPFTVPLLEGKTGRTPDKTLSSCPGFPGHHVALLATYACT